MPEKLTETTQTSKGLRDSLFKAYDELRHDKITHHKAKELCRFASVILNSVKLEIEAARFISSSSNKQKETKDGSAIPVLDL